MKRIFKYPIEITDEPRVEMPRAAKILTVQTQSDMPFVWALVEDDAPMVTHVFKLRGTGHPAEDCFDHHYIGTFQMRGGSLVFHLFNDGER